ncbi:MAG: hypothetical protein AB1813_07675 [Verrucomicrobiota bacterium]|jgi:hypothetical protein
MNTTHRPCIHRLTLALFSVGCLSFGLLAQEESEHRNRLSVGGRLFFNISAQIRNLPAPAQPAGIYDDGFVLSDISGNRGGRTWNWGYLADNQVVGASPNRAIDMHRAGSPRDGRIEDLPDDPQYGFDLGYGRDFFRIPLGEKSQIKIGFEMGFGSSALSLKGEDTITGSVTRRTDRFNLGSTVPPLAPYAGTFAGPGPLIDAAGVAQPDTTATATSQQLSKLEGVFYGFQIGPFVEIPLPLGLELEVAGGFAAINVDADFSYNELLTISGTGGPPAPRIDKNSESKWITGFYGEAKLSFPIYYATRLYVGGEYQVLDDFSIRAGSKEATIDFGEALAVKAGVTFSF